MASSVGACCLRSYETGMGRLLDESELDQPVHPSPYLRSGTEKALKNDSKYRLPDLWVHEWVFRRLVFFRENRVGSVGIAPMGAPATHDAGHCLTHRCPTPFSPVSPPGLRVTV